MRIARVVLGVLALIVSTVVLQAETAPNCPAEKRITTESAAIEVARQYFTKQRKLIRRIGGAGIDAVARNLSGDCCEVIKDEHGNWHVDMMDRRDNPRTVFAYSFDACGNAVETRHSKDAAGKK